MIKEEPSPMHIYRGEHSSEATVCALIAVLNHDVKSGTSYLAGCLYP